MTGEEGTKGAHSVTNSTNKDTLGDNTSNGQNNSSDLLDKDGVSKAIAIKDKNSNNIRDRDSGVENNSDDLLNSKRNGRAIVVDNSREESSLLVSPAIYVATEVNNLSNEELKEAYRDLARYAETLKKDNAQLKESEEKLRIQHVEASRRENVLVMRLTTKEQELQDYVAQVNELKSSIAPTSASLRSTFTDPAVNLVIQKMKKELEETKKKLEDTQNDLNAWKFTPDSNTGKRLMAKCRMLYQENEDLGKMITSGRLAKLESDLALQKSLTEEMKKSQSEVDELIQELDEDVEGMQSTIYYLQQQLRNLKSETDANSGNAQSSSTQHNETNFSSEIVTLTVKITDLCSQCQDTQQKKKELPSSVKMEVDERTFVNGENSNSSHSDSEQLTTSTTTSFNNDRTKTNSSNNAKHTFSEFKLNDPKISDSNDVSSESLNQERTSEPGSGGDDAIATDEDVPPATKRSKMANNNKRSATKP